MADAKLHRYRSHTCGALRSSDIGSDVRISGWVHRVRDHGGLLFIDLRDHYGLTQIVADPDSPAFKAAETVRSEWVIRVDGKVRQRPEGTLNKELPTGEVELFATEIEVLSQAKELPVPVFGEPDYPEDLRLTYRFLGLAPAVAARHHHEAARHHALDPQPHACGWLQRIPDADPDRVPRRRGRATSSCPRVSIPASSTRCPRRRSSTSSC